MRLPIRLIGTLAVIALTGSAGAIVLAQSSATSSLSAVDSTYPLLGSCSQLDTENVFSISTEERAAFPETATVTDIWSQNFHQIVGGVVADYQDPAKKVYECLDTSASDVVQPPESLKRLAVELVPWQDEQNLSELSRVDITSVLMEYLRVYECALFERESFLDVQISSELGEVAEGRITDTPAVALQASQEKVQLQHERTIARRSVERTLVALSALNRFSTFETELTCMQKASVDVRNALGLAAEAASCLPRVWNARDPLRDITP